MSRVLIYILDNVKDERDFPSNCFQYFLEHTTLFNKFPPKPFANLKLFYYQNVYKFICKMSSKVFHQTYREMYFGTLLNMSTALFLFRIAL